MAEVVCKDYESSLKDLKINSKPLINMLTMLADENKEHAPDIVRLIEKRMEKAKGTEKLPIIYLMDSVIKNIKGGPYLALFSKNVVKNFAGVFEQGDEKIRTSLFKLRSTWNEYFGNDHLYALDVRVKKLDPAWPIMATPPVQPRPVVQAPSIHVNPKFIKKTAIQPKAAQVRPVQQRPVKSSPAVQPVVKPAAGTAASAKANVKELQLKEQEMRSNLVAKQQELLQIHKQRLELELQQTKARLQEQALELERKNIELQRQKILQQQQQQVFAAQAQLAAPVVMVPTPAVMPAPAVMPTSAAMPTPATVPSPVVTPSPVAKPSPSAMTSTAVVTPSTVTETPVASVAPRSSAGQAPAVATKAAKSTNYPTASAGWGSTQVTPPQPGSEKVNPSFGVTRDPRTASRRDPRLARDPRVKNVTTASVKPVSTKEQPKAEAAPPSQPKQEQEAAAKPTATPASNSSPVKVAPSVSKDPRRAAKDPRLRAKAAQNKAVVPPVKRKGPPTPDKGDATMKEAKVEKLDLIAVSDDEGPSDVKPAKEGATSQRNRANSSDGSRSPKGKSGSTVDKSKDSGPGRTRNDRPRRSSHRSRSRSRSPPRRSSRYSTRSSSRRRSSDERDRPEKDRKDDRPKTRDRRDDRESRERRDISKLGRIPKKAETAKVEEGNVDVPAKRKSPPRDRKGQVSPGKTGPVESASKRGRFERLDLLERFPERGRGFAGRGGGVPPGYDERDRRQYERGMVPPVRGRRRSSIDPSVVIPKELASDRISSILTQIDQQLRLGQLSHEEHQKLLGQLDDLYQFQKSREEEAKPPMNSLFAARSSREGLLGDGPLRRGILGDGPLKDRPLLDKPEMDRPKMDRPLVDRTDIYIYRLRGGTINKEPELPESDDSYVMEVARKMEIHERMAMPKASEVPPQPGHVQYPPSLPPQAQQPAGQHPVIEPPVQQASVQQPLLDQPLTLSEHPPLQPPSVPQTVVQQPPEAQENPFGFPVGGDVDLRVLDPNYQRMVQQEVERKLRAESSSGLTEPAVKEPVMKEPVVGGQNVPAESVLPKQEVPAQTVLSTENIVPAKEEPSDIIEPSKDIVPAAGAPPEKGFAPENVSSHVPIPPEEIVSPKAVEPKVDQKNLEKEEPHDTVPEAVPEQQLPEKPVPEQPLPEAKEISNKEPAESPATESKKCPEDEDSTLISPLSPPPEDRDERLTAVVGEKAPEEETNAGEMPQEDKAEPAGLSQSGPERMDVDERLLSPKKKDQDERVKVSVKDLDERMHPSVKDRDDRLDASTEKLDQEISALKTDVEMKKQGDESPILEDKKSAVVHLDVDDRKKKVVADINLKDVQVRVSDIMKHTKKGIGNVPDKSTPQKDVDGRKGDISALSKKGKPERTENKSLMDDADEITVGEKTESSRPDKDDRKPVEKDVDYREKAQTVEPSKVADIDERKPGAADKVTIRKASESDIDDRIPPKLVSEDSINRADVDSRLPAVDIKAKDVDERVLEGKMSRVNKVLENKDVDLRMTSTQQPASEIQVSRKDSESDTLTDSPSMDKMEVDPSPSHEPAGGVESKDSVEGAIKQDVDQRKSLNKAEDTTEEPAEGEKASDVVKKTTRTIQKRPMKGKGQQIKQAKIQKKKMERLMQKKQEFLQSDFLKGGLLQEEAKKQERLKIERQKEEERQQELLREAELDAAAAEKERFLRALEQQQKKNAQKKAPNERPPEEENNDDLLPAAFRDVVEPTAKDQDLRDVDARVPPQGHQPPRARSWSDVPLDFFDEEGKRGPDASEVKLDVDLRRLPLQEGPCGPSQGPRGPQIMGFPPRQQGPLFNRPPILLEPGRPIHEEHHPRPRMDQLGRPRHELPPADFHGPRGPMPRMEERPRRPLPRPPLRPPLPGGPPQGPHTYPQGPPRYRGPPQEGPGEGHGLQRIPRRRGHEGSPLNNDPRFGDSRQRRSPPHEFEDMMPPMNRRQREEMRRGQRFEDDYPPRELVDVDPRFPEDRRPPRNPRMEELGRPMPRRGPMLDERSPRNSPRHFTEHLEDLPPPDLTPMEDENPYLMERDDLPFIPARRGEDGPPRLVKERPYDPHQPGINPQEPMYRPQILRGEHLREPGPSNLERIPTPPHMIRLPGGPPQRERLPGPPVHMVRIQGPPPMERMPGPPGQPIPVEPIPGQPQLIRIIGPPGMDHAPGQPHLVRFLGPPGLEGMPIQPMDPPMPGQLQTRLILVPTAGPRFAGPPEVQGLPPGEQPRMQLIPVEQPPLPTYIPTPMPAPLGQGRPLPVAPMQPRMPISEPAQSTLKSQVDINDLLKKLMSSGILAKPQSPAPDSVTPPPTEKEGTPQGTEEVEEGQTKENKTGAAEGKDSKKKGDNDWWDEGKAAEKEKKKPRVKLPEELSLPPDKLVIPSLVLGTTELKQRIPGVIHSIISGTQCSSCGMRFSIEHMDDYRKHLDLHFRQNRRDNDSVKSATCRKWFYELDEWMVYEELEATEEGYGVDPATEQAPENKGVPVTGVEEDEYCKICQEPFEQYWDEDDEAWMLRDAIKVNGKTYHPACYGDVKNSSIFEEPSGEFHGIPGVTDDVMDEPDVSNREAAEEEVGGTQVEEAKIKLAEILKPPELSSEVKVEVKTESKEEVEVKVESESKPEDTSQTESSKVVSAGAEDSKDTVPDRTTADKNVEKNEVVVKTEDVDNPEEVVKRENVSKTEDEATKKAEVPEDKTSEVLVTLKEEGTEAPAAEEVETESKPCQKSEDISEKSEVKEVSKDLSPESSIAKESKDQELMEKPATTLQEMVPASKETLATPEETPASEETLAFSQETSVPTETSAVPEESPVPMETLPVTEAPSVAGETLAVPLETPAPMEVLPVSEAPDVVRMTLPLPDKSVDTAALPEPVVASIAIPSVPSEDDLSDSQPPEQLFSDSVLPESVTPTEDEPMEFPVVSNLTGPVFVGGPMDTGLPSDADDENAGFSRIFVDFIDDDEPLPMPTGVMQDDFQPESFLGNAGQADDPFFVHPPEGMDHEMVEPGTPSLGLHPGPGGDQQEWMQQSDNADLPSQGDLEPMAIDRSARDAALSAIAEMIPPHMEQSAINQKSVARELLAQTPASDQESMGAEQMASVDQVAPTSLSIASETSFASEDESRVTSSMDKTASGPDVEEARENAQGFPESDESAASLKIVTSSEEQTGVSSGVDASTASEGELDERDKGGNS